MGVNISDLLVAEPIDLSALSGKVLAIDSLNMIYQFLGNIRQHDGTPLMDSKGNVTSHLSGLFYRNINFNEKGMKVAYVFDGKPPELKNAELADRKSNRELAKENWQKALEEGRLEEAKKYAQRSTVVTDEIIAESKRLLEAMGIPVIQAKCEGEAQCAKICRDGKAYAAVTQDFDSILFGSPRTIRHLSSKSEVPQIIELSKQKLTREQLIMIGILVGTDYNPKGVMGIGPKKALGLVEKFKTLEEIKKQIKWEFDISMEELYEFFLNPPVYENYEIKFGRPDRDRVIEILCKDHDFSQDRVNKGLDKLDSKRNSQTSLLGF
jgi:flap endonuclease-1